MMGETGAGVTSPGIPGARLESVEIHGMMAISP